MSDTLTLSRDEYRDKVLGCWTGKAIGGTLGGPLEGLRHTHDLQFYDPPPDEAAPNDDLDLQLVWLKMLEDEGIDPPLPTFARYWAQYACRYPWNEYGFFMHNYSRGLRPPVAGCFENYFVDEMGSPIRSEIWACLHPADPDRAARMAWKDSALDHAGGEGMWGEMFWAALEAAAFVENDPRRLIQIGLEAIPIASQISRSIREALWCRDQGLSWGKARERINVFFGKHQACNAVPNHAFAIIGWLWGKDFGDRLCKAVNCGYDTDCTGATLGALLGILEGRSAIPQKWIDPIGERLVLHPFTGPCDPPATLDQLSNRCIALAERAAQQRPDFAFGEATRLPEDLDARLTRRDKIRAMRALDCQAGVELLPDGREIWLHYDGEPVLRPGLPRHLRLALVAPREGESITLQAPDGIEVVEQGPGLFLLRCEEKPPARIPLQVCIGTQEIGFTLLGPDEARGFGAGENVPHCTGCGARVEACFCPPQD